MNIGSMDKKSKFELFSLVAMHALLSNPAFKDHPEHKISEIAVANAEMAISDIESHIKENPIEFKKPNVVRNGRGFNANKETIKSKGCE
jgi:hypothetical protein